MLNITSGRVPKPQKVVLYGPEGIGKSTFAARFPDPVFIDTEGSTYHMDVRRTNKPASWQELMEQVKQIAKSPGLCKTLVLDTADWAEMICTENVCDKYQKKGIEDFGYGKGYVFLQEEFGKLLNAMEDVINAGMNVVITAHAKMRKFEQPDETGSYDRWEMKLSKQVAPMVKEWADMVLFANYKTYVVAADDKGKKHKAQGGKRVMHTSHHPCWDAKNRHDLPEELPLDYAAIAHCIERAEHATPACASGQATQRSEDTASVQPKTESALLNVPQKLLSLMQSSQIEEADIRYVFHDVKGYYPYDIPWEVLEQEGFIDGWIIPYWNAIVDEVRKKQKNDGDLPYNY